MKCNHVGCAAEAIAKGWCKYHYKVARYGRTPRPTRGMTLSQRLEFYTDSSGGPDACWLWTGHTDTCGYGMIGVPGGKKHRAHRVRWELTFGPIGELQVLHRCDTPGCNNPKHLFVGTHLDNMADRDAKGRGNQQKGERAARSKLTEADVRAILDSPLPYSALAGQYGVTKENIAAIKQRRSWRHLS